MLLSSNFYKHFIQIKGIAVALMFALQLSGVFGSKLDAPQSDRFVANGDAALSQKIFDIAIAEVESIVLPNGVTDDFGWKTMSFVSIHARIMGYSVLS